LLHGVHRIFIKTQHLFLYKTDRESYKSSMKKYLAELVGTFILVLFGCGTAVVAGDKVGILGIAFAFGLALIGAAYGIAPSPAAISIQPSVWACGPPEECRPKT
jgi:hypothetical protein